MAVKDKKKKKKGSGFVYKATTPDRLKRQAEQTGSRFDGIFKNGIELFKFKPGDNTFRILPATWDNAEYYGMEVFVHPYVGANNGTYLCLAQMKKQKCPICEASKDARDAGDKEEATELSFKQRYLFWVIDRDDESSGPKVLDMSWSMDQAIAALCVHKRSGKVVAIDNPDEGRDITIQKRGQGINTKYFGHRIDSDASPISDDEDQQDSILEEIRENALPDILHYYPAEYLKGVMSGTVSEDDEEDEDEDEPKKKKKGGKVKDDKKKKRRDEDEDDDEDEEPFEEDEDEDEKPSKKKKPSKRRDEEDEDDDEDEDERPTRKSAKKDDKKKKRRDDDDEDEDEDPDEAEDDDDEDEKPAKKKAGKSSSKRSSRSDDDDDDDEDDEEEEEEPKKKSSPKKDTDAGGKSKRATRFGR